MSKEIITQQQEFKDLGISAEKFYSTGGNNYVNIKIGDTSYSIQLVVPTPTVTMTPSVTITPSPSITPTETETPTPTPTPTVTPTVTPTSP